MLDRLIRFIYAAALFTLPWVGMGVMTLVTGRDLGAGMQPAWLLLALGCLLGLSRARLIHVAGGVSVLRTPGVGRPWGLWLLVALAAVIVSALGLSLAPSGVEAKTVGLRWVKQVVQLAVMLAFVVCPAVWTRGPGRWRFTLRWLTAGLIFQLGYGLLQAVEYFHPVGLLAWLEIFFTSNPAILSGSAELYVGDGFLPIPRLRGTMCEPLFLGNYLIFLWPWLMCSGLLRRRWVSWLAVGMGLLLLGTWARGAWLAALGQAALWGLWHWRARGGSAAGLSLKRTVLPVLGGLGLLILLVGVFGGGDKLLLPWERLLQAFSRHDWSTLPRLYSMQAAWRAFLLSPLVGVGWGQFAFHFPLLVDPMGLQSQFSWPVVNNMPLKILCEMGGVGFGVFLGFSLWLGRRTLQALQGVRVPSPVLAGALSLVGVWIQLLTFSQYNLAHIWLALGLLVAALCDKTVREGD